MNFSLAHLRGNLMGFNEARRLTIEALRDGRFQHEPRPYALDKNLLATGDVSVDDVIYLLQRCRGTQFETRPHQDDPSQELNIFKPSWGRTRWYIKSYLVEIDEITAVFISVHESEYQ
jgi:hypothetical protein